MVTPQTNINKLILSLNAKTRGSELISPLIVFSQTHPNQIETNNTNNQIDMELLYKVNAFSELRYSERTIIENTPVIIHKIINN